MTTKNLETTFPKYKANLRLVDTAGGLLVKSYDTIVAEVDYETNTLWEFGWWSSTTKKHINYVAEQLNLKIVQTPFYMKNII